MRISDWSSDVCSSDLPTPEFVDDDACHLAGVDDGLCDRDREGDDFAKCVAIENPEPVRSSDFDKMLAAGLITTRDRQSVVWGKRVSVRVDLGCSRILTHKTHQYVHHRPTP